MSMELLAPAGDREALIAAVQNGADAVYLGARMLNARSGAGNFDRDGLKWAVDYAHERGVRVHVTVNTMVKQEELGLVEQVAGQIAFAGADAAIVQDLGVARLLRAMLPSLSLHASTQMAVHNRQGVRFARSMGMDRVVLAREMTYEEMADCAAEGVELEAFAHGALCVSCSGQCLFSSLVGGRSGNRGQCAQPCRLPYRLEGAVRASGCLLSPRDLMSLEHLEDLSRAGIGSLKIEGRLKRPEYVAVVTRVYREALDLLETFGDYAPEDETREELMQIFNRGGFTQGYGPGLVDQELMSRAKPNHMGVPVGELTARGQIRLTRDVSQADALAFRDKSGDEFPVRGLCGSADDVLRVRTPDGARPGAILWRLVCDGQMKDARQSMTGEHRKSFVTGFLSARTGEKARFDVADGESAVSAVGNTVEKATGKPADLARIRAQLAKTGSVPFDFVDLTLNVDADAFLPASELNELRRAALKRLSDEKIRNARGCAASLRPDRPPEPRLRPGASVALRVQVPSIDLMERALAAGADEVIFQPEDVTAEGLGKGIRPPVRYVLAVPQTLSTDALNGLNGWALEHSGDISAVLLSNPGHLALQWPGEIQLDWGLNLANRQALAGLFERGAALYTPSLELNCGEIRALDPEGGSRELIVYGRMQLMALRHCPVRAQTGGAHGDCARCDIVAEDKRLNAHVLIDRTQTAFPMRRQKSADGCVIRLMNSVPLMVLRRADRLPRACCWRVILTDESPERAESIVRLHRMVLDGKAWRDSPEWAALDGMPSTTGHYFRGVV